MKYPNCSSLRIQFHSFVVKDSKKSNVKLYTKYYKSGFLVEPIKITKYFAEDCP